MDIKQIKNKEADIDLDNITEAEFRANLKEDVDTKEVDDQEEVKTEPEEVREEKKVEVKTEEASEPEEVDYREKFKQSSKEALRLREENQKLLEEKERLAQKRTITEEELRVKYSDWDDKTKSEKEAITDKENIEIRFKALEAVNQMYVNEKKFNEQISSQIELWTATGEYKDIVAHQDEFKKFCRKDGNKGLDTDKLAKLFLYDLPVETPKRGNTPMGKSGNKKEEVKTKTYTEIDSSNLRKTNPRLWQKMLLEGKFKK